MVVEVFYSVVRKKYIVVMGNEIIRTTENQAMANLSAKTIAEENKVKAIYCFD